MTQKMQKYWNKNDQAVNSEDWKQEKKWREKYKTREKERDTWRAEKESSERGRETIN